MIKEVVFSHLSINMKCFLAYATEVKKKFFFYFKSLCNINTAVLTKGLS